MKKGKSIRVRLEEFASSEKGRRLWNYGYSWGASVIILGAMFKILHFPYANEILFVAMTFESIVFFMSAFDRSTVELHRPQQPDDTQTWPDGQPQRVHQPVSASPSGELQHYSQLYKEQLEILSRHIGDISEMYEHIVPDSFRIRMETEKMVRQMEHLNKIYGRLIQSMTHTDLPNDVFKEMGGEDHD